MKRCLTLASAAAVVLCGLTQAHAIIITSDFTASSEGWSVTGGNPTHVAAGGNPGGYFQATDSQNTVLTSFAPAAFLGNISAYDGGQIGFDSQLFKATGSPQPQFGIISISDGITTATLDLGPAGAPTLGSWSTYTAAFDAATWGLSGAAWTTLLSNVTSITLVLESTFGQGEVVGLDNFFIENENINEPVVPEPASLALLLIGSSGIAGFGYLRRKKPVAA